MISPGERMGSEATLRHAQPEDEPFLYRVYASTRAEELAPVPWTPEQKDAFLRMQFQAQDAYYREHYPGATFLVVQLEGGPVGRLYVHRRPGEIRVMDLALLPEHRGRGVGAALLRQLQEEAAGAGKPLTIHVERFNPALRLYERLGFERVEDKGVYLFLRWEPRTASVRGVS